MVKGEIMHKLKASALSARDCIRPPTHLHYASCCQRARNCILCACLYHLFDLILTCQARPGMVAAREMSSCLSVVTSCLCWDPQNTRNTSTSGTASANLTSNWLPPLTEDSWGEMDMGPSRVESWVLQVDMFS